MPPPDGLRVSRIQFDARALRERAWPEQAWLQVLRERAWPRAVLAWLRVLQAWLSAAGLAFPRERHYAPAQETQHGWVEPPALRV